MDFFKTIGLGVYYRVRRMSKALKNWRKFGVIIFGGLLIAMNFGGLMPVKSVDADVPKLTYLYIEPSTLSIIEGQSYTVKAKAYDQNWAPMTVTPTWSMNKTLAGSITSGGVFTASHTLGTYTNAIKLSTGALSTYAAVVVAKDNTSPPPPVQKLTYLYTDPLELTIEEGTSHTFGYKAYDQDMNPMTIVPQWSMNKLAAGSINGSGVFTASHALGAYTNAVKVTNGVLAAYARVTITPNAQPQPTWVTFEINPPSITRVLPAMGGSTSQNFTYDSRLSNSVFAQPDSIDWNLQGVGTGYFDGTVFRYTSTQSGTATLTATAHYQGATKSDVSYITITRETPPAATCSYVNISDSAVNLYVGESKYIGYTALKTDGSSMDPDEIQWTWTGGFFNANSQTYYATAQGNFALTAACRINPSVHDSMSVSVSDIIVQEEYLVRTDISADRTYLHYNESTNLSTQAWSNLGNHLNATYHWDKISGPGYLSGDVNSQYGARLVAQNATGYAVVKITAYYGGRTADNVISVLIDNGVIPPVPTPTDLRASIVGRLEGDDVACRADIINYTITITNPQSVTVTGAKMVMALPQGTSFLSASSNIDHPRISGNMITWDAGTLYSGQAETMLLRVRVNDNLATVPTQITATMFVSADQKPGFNVNSNALSTCGQGGPVTPTQPLASTGVEWWTWLAIGLASLALTTLTYGLMNRRRATELTW
ncbi:MAG: hypothetical protein V1826_02135 [bacterium]